MIKDNQLDRPLYIRDVVGLLNEQQAAISRLEEKNGALKKFIKDNFDEMMDSKMVIDDELLHDVFDELYSMRIYNKNNCEAFTKEINYLIKRIKEQCEEEL